MRERAPKDESCELVWRAYVSCALLVPEMWADEAVIREVGGEAVREKVASAVYGTVKDR